MTQIPIPDRDDAVRSARPARSGPNGRARRAPLVVVSGLDGAGKTTQIGRLTSHLRDAGLDPVVIWTRGGYTPTFERLKRLLRRAAGGKLAPAGQSAQRQRALGRPAVRKVWLTIAMVDLMWVYGVAIRRHLSRGRPVICDRYLWDTLLDFRINFPAERVERWWLWRLLVLATPRPDAAFLLLIPVEESQRRSVLKGEPFPDSPEVLATRLAQYQELARAGHWEVLDGREPLESVFARIRAAVDALLPGGGGAGRQPARVHAD